VINTEVTEKKGMEAQFLRAQRMESIGTLAGGIAHDLNNVLSPILMAIDMLQLKTTDEASKKWLDVLRANAERGGDMVRQVLSFARGVEGERVALQPKHLIKEIVKILRETLPKSIEITFQLPDDLCIISADATQIHQVLMNLCVNARDAMLEGGSISIKAENALVDENYARMHIEAKPGRFIVVTVSDTGPGMPPEIQSRIFEPFFTTKEMSKGTGLGLSTALTIVKSHGGFMNVYSEINKGSQFAVYLPALDAPGKTEAGALQTDLPIGHGELILVVDDEESIREITRGTLETFGYEVLTASDGTEAVALYADRKNEIAVVLTDMMMPFMDGPATIRALQKMNPAIKIIAASGLAGGHKPGEASLEGVKLFLSKPYTAEKLLKALAELLTS
jgi:nitrogen-specific signal transduction histidine kinase